MENIRPPIIVSGGLILPYWIYYSIQAYQILQLWASVKKMWFVSDLQQCFPILIYIGKNDMLSIVLILSSCNRIMYNKFLSKSLHISFINIYWYDTPMPLIIHSRTKYMSLDNFSPDITTNIYKYTRFCRQPRHLKMQILGVHPPLLAVVLKLDTDCSPIWKISGHLPSLRRPDWCFVTAVQYLLSGKICEL